jgi:D-alanine-D-alanine ligase
LVFGGRTVEHKVSVTSSRTVAAALEAAGHEVVPFGIGLNGVWLDAEASRPALAGEVDVVDAPDAPVAPSVRPFVESAVDVAFPVVHGTWGEDGTLQGLFEMLDLPYVGAGVTASAVAMDKVLCKRVLEGAGVPVVEYVAARQAELDADHDGVLARLKTLEPPVFVKPSVGGSSVGIRRVASLEDLGEAVTFAFGFDDQVLVETEIVGRELECSVLGYPSLEASAIGEIVPGADFYDYADKYLDDNAGLHVPAELEPEIEADLRNVAVRAFGAIGGFGMARVDFLLRDDGEMFVNEINTLPGFTSISMYPKLWEASGLPPAALVDRLVQEGIARHADRQRLDQGIKEWVAQLERG